MPNCELRRCALKGCRNEFRPKREAQVYCKTACRNAAHKRPKKRRLALERVDIPRSVANGLFLQGNRAWCPPMMARTSLTTKCLQLPSRMILRI